MIVNLKHEVKPGIVQVNLDERRWYREELEDGSFNYYPSVTWILDYYPKGIGFKKWLMGLADEAEGNRALREGGDRGSKVHWGVEQLLSRKTLHFSDVPYGYDEPFNANEWSYILTFINWYEDYKPTVLGIEETIIERNNGYGGTIDLDCIIEDDKPETVLVDWKTSSQIYDTHKIQLTAYAKAYPKAIDRIMIVKLGHSYKRGYQIWDMDYNEAVETYFPLFLAAKRIWEYENKNVVPKFMECPETLTLIGGDDVEERHETENSDRPTGEDQNGEEIREGVSSVA